jgi:hypothetical protein
MADCMSDNLLDQIQQPLKSLYGLWPGGGLTQDVLEAIEEPLLALRYDLFAQGCA